MKLQYHKIPKIETSVCTAEQMIAYNLAFRADISFGAEFKKLETEVTKSQTIAEIIKMSIKNYQSAYDYKKDKYNIDAIFCALNAGLQKYLEKPFIASDYETIGKTFTANYL